MKSGAVDVEGVPNATEAIVATAVTGAIAVTADMVVANAGKTAEVIEEDAVASANVARSRPIVPTT